MNRRSNKNENGVGNEIFTTHENGVGNEIFTATVDAQGVTGANCSATNTIDIIHNYRQFEVPQDVGVF
jgi:hypothetical protein